MSDSFIARLYVRSTDAGKHVRLTVYPNSLDYEEQPINYGSRRMCKLERIHFEDCPEIAGIYDGRSWNLDMVNDLITTALDETV